MKNRRIIVPGHKLSARAFAALGYPHLNAFEDKHRKIRYRYRKSGRSTVYIHGTFGSPEFRAAYEAACAGDTTTISPGSSRTIPGTLNALAVSVYASAEWRLLKPSTHNTYRGVIERMRTAHGNQPLSGLRKKHILIMRDEIASPTAANTFVKVMRWMMAFAENRQLRADNPTAGIKLLKVKTDGYPSWTEEDARRFEAHWPVGTRQRLAFDLLLYTAQRSGDVRQMSHEQIRDGYINLTQEKTGAKLRIPVLEPLRHSLDAHRSNASVLVATGGGDPYTAAGFGNWFRDACRSAGIIDRSAHGLRKLAATRLADAGCSESQIKAITGHKTAKEVERYTQARDQKLLADSAFAKIGPKRKPGETKDGPHLDGGDLEPVG